MEAPQITRQHAFNYSLIYEEVVNTLDEVNLENEIVYRSVPVLEKSKSEEYNKKDLKVTRSYSY